MLKHEEIFLRFIVAILLLVNFTSFALADVTINSSNFPDNIFRQYVSEHFDHDDNGILTDDEIYQVNGVEIEEEAGLESLAGIENFYNLTYITCQKNKLTSLNLSKNPKIMILTLHDNNLAALDVSDLKELTELYCGNNPNLSSLNLGSQPNLKTLEIYSGNLSNLDVSQCYKLKNLTLTGNKILIILMYLNVQNY